MSVKCTLRTFLRSIDAKYRTPPFRFQNIMSLRELQKPAVPPSCFVSGAQAVILRMSRYAGIAPVTLIKEAGGWRASFSQPFYLYGHILATILNIFVFIITIIDNVRGTESFTSSAQLVVRIVDSILLIILTSVAVYGSRKYFTTMVSCLNGLQKIIQQLGNINGFNTSERQKTIFLIIWVGSPMILNGLGVIFVIKYAPEQAYKSIWHFFYLPNHICYFILQLVLLKFIMITGQVLNAFRVINGSLRTLLEEQSLKSEQSQHYTIRALRSSYSSACNIVRDVSKCYGTILLMLLGVFLLNIIVSLYYLIKNLMPNILYHQRPGAYPVAKIFMQLIWSFYHVFKLVIVIEPCHNTHSEMGITRKLVSRLMISSGSIYEPSSVELELFYRLLLAKHASYSPLKVITMSRSLIIAMFGSVTTYLIILLDL